MDMLSHGLTFAAVSAIVAAAVSYGMLRASVSFLRVLLDELKRTVAEQSKEITALRIKVAVLTNETKHNGND